MSEKPVKILLPKDRFQIGNTPDGQPVWVEPKELLPTEDEKLELKQNLLNSRERGAIEKLTHSVIENAARFVQATFLAIAPPGIVRAHENNEMGRVAAWAKENQYEVIQDGLRTVVKVRGKVIREFVARVSPACADLVEREVKRIVATQN